MNSVPTYKLDIGGFVPQMAKRSSGSGGGGGRSRNGGRGSAGSAPAHGSLPVMADRGMSMSSSGGDDPKGRKQKTDRDRDRDRGGVGGAGGSGGGGVGGGVAADGVVKAPPGKKSRKGTAGWRGERRRGGKVIYAEMHRCRDKIVADIGTSRLASVRAGSSHLEGERARVAEESVARKFLCRRNTTS